MTHFIRVFTLAMATALVISCGSDDTGGSGAGVGGGNGGDGSATQIHSYKVVQRYSDFFKRDITYHGLEVNAGKEAVYLQRYGANTRMEAGKVYAKYFCSESPSCAVFVLDQKGEFSQVHSGVSVYVREDSSSGRRTIEISDPYRWVFAEGAQFSIQAEKGDQKSAETTATLTKE